MKRTFKAMSLLSLGLALLPGAVSLAPAAEPITVNVLAAWPKSAPVVEFFVKDFVEGLQKFVVMSDQRNKPALKIEGH